MKIKSKINYVGKVSCLILLLTCTLMLFPTVGDTYAEGAPEDLIAIETLDTETRVWVRPTLSIAVSPKVDIDVVPRSAGTFSQSTARLDVATNSRNGLQVLLGAVDGNNELKTNNPSNSHTIKSLATATKPNDFTPNTWGYNVGDASGSYYPIPTSNATILVTDSSEETQNYDLNFGVLVDTSLPAGLYANSVIISVVANPADAVKLEDLYYLQDMRGYICDGTSSIEEYKILIDKRDDAGYRTAKLRDGRCWMANDLGLTLSPEKTLTPEDTDIDEPWTPPFATNNGLANAAGEIDNGRSWIYNGRRYYQFSAATAGTGATASNNGNRASGSICPRGWRLPTIAEFQKLMAAYTTTNLGSAPLNFNYTGAINTNRGELAEAAHIFVWAGELFNSASARILYGVNYPTTGANAQYDSLPAAYGAMVRCIADDKSE